MAEPLPERRVRHRAIEHVRAAGRPNSDESGPVLATRPAQVGQNIGPKVAPTGPNSVNTRPRLGKLIFTFTNIRAALVDIGCIVQSRPTLAHFWSITQTWARTFTAILYHKIQLSMITEMRKHFEEYSFSFVPTLFVTLRRFALRCRRHRECSAPTTH